jgi:hypothetical protein
MESRHTDRRKCRLGARTQPPRPGGSLVLRPLKPFVGCSELRLRRFSLYKRRMSSDPLYIEKWDVYKYPSAHYGEPPYKPTPGDRLLSDMQLGRLAWVRGHVFCTLDAQKPPPMASRRA